MIRRLLAVVLALLLGGLWAQEPESIAERGANVYATWCAHCHDRLPEDSALEMLPGPASLTLKYGGALSPYIEERKDLANFNVLAVYLRNGSGSMPPFRKTEITDEDIAAIAAYISQTSSD